MRRKYAYYNDNDPYCCEWLRALVAKGLIAPGEVDARPIQEVEPDDLKGFAQAHFFAGIGGWSAALRLAKWPDDRPVWTGSCPCQPFSAAGKRKGAEDERHLWPEFHRLIAECRPATVFGEQVASPLGRNWLAVVRLQMEALGYAVGAADLCAAGMGAPHIRQRLWFVADSENRRSERNFGTRRLRGSGTSGELADTECNPRDARRASIEPREGTGTPQTRAPTEPGRCGVSRTLANANGGHSGTERLQRSGEYGCEPEGDGTVGHADTERSQGWGVNTREHPSERIVGKASPWDNPIWLPCTDGKQRPTQPGIFPLAHGISKRVPKLRAIGNAIVPQVAAVFIEAAKNFGPGVEKCESSY